MHYEIKQIELHNKNGTRKKLIIEFFDPAYALLGEFLNVDASLLNWYILREVKAVLDNEKDQVESSGNRTSITVTKEQTRIEDLFDGIIADEDVLTPIVIETDTLYQILVNWHAAIDKFNSEYKS